MTVRLKKARAIGTSHRAVVINTRRLRPTVSIVVMAMQDSSVMVNVRDRKAIIIAMDKAPDLRAMHIATDRAPDLKSKATSSVVAPRVKANGHSLSNIAMAVIIPARRKATSHAVIADLNNKATAARPRTTVSMVNVSAVPSRAIAAHKTSVVVACLSNRVIVVAARTWHKDIVRSHPLPALKTEIVSVELNLRTSVIAAHADNVLRWDLAMDSAALT